jgi:methylenetetrahydrofolate reductase (NADPH)
MNRFRDVLLGGNEFVITCELIPGRGFTGKSIDQVLHFAEEVRDLPGVHALSLTDNAGGNPALSADVLGTEILSMGVDLIVHFTTKDSNRNAIESRAYALQRFGITNLLVITGDFPISGYYGIPKPSFDMDSVSALYYLNAMNQGLDIQMGRKEITLEKTDFFLGACASPFKWTEGSNKMQYHKLEKKIRAGAHYFITQLGYDYRKYLEMLRYVRGHLGLHVPLIGSIYLLTRGAAKLMNKGEIPGAWVSEDYITRLNEEAKAEDKGKSKRLERAAKQLALLKGMGYSGAHIEGLNLKTNDVREIMERAVDIGENWRDHIREFDSAPEKPFYLFKDGDRFEVPGDNGNGKKSSAAAVETVKPEFRFTPRKSIFSPTFWATRLLHKMFFIPDTAGYKMMRGISKFIEHRKFFYNLFGAFERFTKKLLFDCRQCDDCALFEMFYLCPESQCPKGMRMGPCGGSRVNGHCEVFPENECIWERVYWRAKNRRQCHTLRYIITPRNWGLYETNSWVNYFLGYDHSSITLDVPQEIDRSICESVETERKLLSPKENR